MFTGLDGFTNHLVLQREWKAGYRKGYKDAEEEMAREIRAAYNRGLNQGRQQGWDKALEGWQKAVDEADRDVRMGNERIRELKAVLIAHGIEIPP